MQAPLPTKFLSQHIGVLPNFGSNYNTIPNNMNLSYSLYFLTRFFVFALLSCLLFLTSCKKEEVSGGNTIDALINSDPQYSLLKTAIRYTGLTGTLKAGTLTFFAPNDAAFRAAGFTDTASIVSHSIDSIATILRYHIMGATVPTSLLPKTKIDTPLIPMVLTDTFALRALDTAQASILVINGVFYISNAGQDVFVNGGRITQANITAQNGVIHSIDRLLIPAIGNLSKTISKNPKLSMFSTALKIVGGPTAAYLAGRGPLTVFAPSDQAFADAGITMATLNAMPKDSLAKQLSYHFIKARRFSNHFLNGKVFRTLQGKTITMSVNGATVAVKDAGGSAPALLNKTDYIATNGVIHVIGSFLKYK
jgi:uncharacterized surface protein with fasciclin (FAS1) repeats